MTQIFATVHDLLLCIGEVQESGDGIKATIAAGVKKGIMVRCDDVRLQAEGNPNCWLVILEKVPKFDFAVPIFFLDEKQRMLVTGVGEVREVCLERL